jgi:signal transduction histidine kinase
VDDEKGRKLPAYICQLAEAAAAERAQMLTELASMQRNVDHIKTIVSRQQSQAKATLGVLESVAVADLLDEVLRAVQNGLDRKSIKVERDYAPLPPVRLDRHKLFEMVMNLVSNARQALTSRSATLGGPVDRVLRIGVRPRGDDRLEVEVADNGCGIAPENLARIFTFGFTTRSGGHGFGLHASALAAAEMGGSLSAESAGPDQGARFVIELPRQPPPGYSTSGDSLAQLKTPPPERL